MADPFVAEIKLLGFNFPPRNWTYCNGGLLAISQFSAVFSLLGTFYGGDGRTSFGLPNLNSRSPIGYNMGGSALGLQTFPIGFLGGAQHHTLTLSQLPIHNHSAIFTPEGGGGDTVTLAATTDQGTSATPTTGAYLSQTKATGGPQDSPENIYNDNPTAGSLVELGGISSSGGGGGTVTVGNSGASTSFSTQSPFLAMNFSLSLLGLFPSRN